MNPRDVTALVFTVILVALVVFAALGVFLTEYDKKGD